MTDGLNFPGGLLILYAFINKISRGIHISVINLPKLKTIRRFLLTEISYTKDAYIFFIIKIGGGIENYIIWPSKTKL